MPTTTAGAIIVDNSENPTQVLLTQRNCNPFRGYWCFPGGHIEKFEPAEVGVVREVKEETGLDFSPWFFHYFDEIFEKGNIHNIVLMFYGEVTGELQVQEEEVADIKWFTFDDALKLDLAFTHGEVLKRFLDKYG